MEFKSVGVLLTENCNARCKMCCDKRGYVTGKTLEKKEIDIILFNIKECNSINSIGITGGEPLLYPELINYILEYDFGRKMDFSIKTNGFWGKDKKHADALIKEWNGRISTISLSFDGFHKEFIEIQSIKNILELAFV